MVISFMIINNYFDKKYIELTEDKLIFYRFFGNQTLELKKIRGAYMDDKYNIKILYGKKVKSYRVVNISEGDKPLLKVLIEILNNDKTVFFSENQNLSPWIFGCYIVPMTINNLMDFKSIYSCIFWIIIAIGMIISIYDATYYSNNIFIYNNNLIIVENRLGKNKEYYPNKDKYKFEYNISNYTYSFKPSKNKTIVIPSNITYPVYYKEKLVELYNISNNM
ncbi:hypothetical protein [Clostridium gasigenes]|uniref:Uncharacterized protein n=1 Tax=Clostridium gasigenes TaxID=94869 RepID=A0A7X0SCC1_9CLOT|nr:hypothetical protein [Clostridium gasigenes]MBB6715011.1 hypothetical protein [Clostridium gasigenes]